MLQGKNFNLLEKYKSRSREKKDVIALARPAFSL